VRQSFGIQRASLIASRSWKQIPVGVAVYKACLMKGILKVGRNRCPVPVIGCLNLYVVPHGAGCSGFPQCLLDVTLRDRYRQVVGGPFLAFDAAA